jgi:hypothetical protein
LSDSIAMTRQMLEETADTFGMLDNQNRELDLLLSSGSSSNKSMSGQTLVCRFQGPRRDPVSRLPDNDKLKFVRTPLGHPKSVISAT